MAEAKASTEAPKKTRKGISTARLLRELREFISNNSIDSSKATVNELEEALKDQVLKDLGIS